MTWTFITNHGAVLTKIAQQGQITIRDLAMELGLTERAVARIISDLETEGYLERHRDGRLNWYRVHAELPMRRHDLQHVAVGEVLELLQRCQEAAAKGKARR